MDTAEVAVSLSGTIGLYRENGWYSLVRVVAISIDERSVGAEVEVIPTPGLRSDQGGWHVSCIHEYLTLTPAFWRQPYPSVSIDFDRELVEAVVAFAATLPPEFSPENYRRITEFLRESRNPARCRRGRHAEVIRRPGKTASAFHRDSIHRRPFPRYDDKTSPRSPGVRPMVMRNRHDDANSPGWWDDLPPAVKKRFSRPQPESTPATEPHPELSEPAYRPAVVSDLSRLAILFLVVALANVLFLLLALAFLSGRGPLGS